MERKTDVCEVFQKTINAASASSDRTREDLMIEMMAMLLKWNEEQPRIIYHVDFTKTIGYFDGGGGGEAAEVWLSKLDNIKKTRNWPDNIILENAQCLLIKGGSDWYDLEQDQIKSWEDFKTSFKKAFICAGNLSSRWERMRKRIQLKSEDANAYYYSKRKLCQALQLSFDEMKEQVLIGLRDKDLFCILAAKKHTDAYELGASILKHERLIEARNFLMGESSMTPQQATTKVKRAVKEANQHTRNRKLR